MVETKGDKTATGKLGGTYVNMTPSTEPSDNNSLYIDTADNKLKLKDNSGSVGEVGATSSKILQVYTGTDYNVSLSDSADGAVSTSATHELSSISAANLEGFDYLEIDLIGSARVQPKSDDDDYAQLSLKIEIKEIGGSYSTIFDKIVLENTTITGPGRVDTIDFKQIPYIHTLTAGEKSNGVQIQLTATATGNSSGGGTTIVSYSNSQTILYGRI